MYDSSLPLYIETNDGCERWVPALFSSLSTINTNIKENYKNEGWYIVINNPFLIISKLRDIPIHLRSGNISVFSRVYIGKSYTNFPKHCHFGLGYSDAILEGSVKKYNVMKDLVSSNQIEKNIFSFGKWELSDTEFIHSTLYVGNSHENFLEDNVGTCKIKNDSGYLGCIFNDFIFLNQTYSLKDKKNNKQNIIYFSSELNKIYFPKDF